MSVGSTSFFILIKASKTCGCYSKRGRVAHDGGTSAVLCCGMVSRVAGGCMGMGIGTGTGTGT